MIKKFKTKLMIKYIAIINFASNTLYFGIVVLTYNIIVAQKYFFIKHRYKNNKTIDLFLKGHIEVFSN